MTQLKDIGFQDEVVTGGELTTALSPVNSHISNTSNPHSVTKAQLGLSEVDNTSDLNKPISTATQNALDLKANQSSTYTKVETDGLLLDKVDKVSGKQLSQEDYTTVEKSKLAGVEAGAELNNISDVNATDLTDGGDTTLHTHDSRYYTESETDTFLLAKANDSEVVKLTGNETIAGEKTFTDKQWAKEIQITDQLTLETLTGTGYITFVGYDSSGATLFNISPVPSSASGASNIRLFRDVTTTGDVGLEIYRGNGTSSLNSRMLGYGNTYFNALTGNVGIGNTSPAEKLDVTGKIRASDTIEVNRVSNPSFAWRVSGTQKYGAYYNSSSGYFSISQTGVADHFNIKDGGNVGIGETNPDYKLDVNGAIGFTPGIGTTITPVDNGDIVFQATSNTSLVIKMKGSDGVIRSTTLTLS